MITVAAIGAAVALGGMLPAAGASKNASAKQWAGDVCSAFITFGDAVESTITGLEGSGSVDTASESAKQGLQDAADGLETSLTDAGKPPTPNAQQAQSAIESLSSQLSKDVAAIQQTLTPPPSEPSEIASTFASIGSEVQKAVNQTKSTATTLQGLKGDNALKKGFQSASSCQQLKGDL
jgi:hypothetical protein